MIVGGEVDAQKLDRLRSTTGDFIEWVGNDGVARLEARIRDGRVAALVVLDALVSHSGIEPIVGRARDHGVPLEYGGKAGLASIRAALVRLEARTGAAAA